MTVTVQDYFWWIFQLSFFRQCPGICECQKAAENIISYHITALIRAIHVPNVLFRRKLALLSLLVKCTFLTNVLL